ncbi:MAG: VOC family protein [Bacteroidota bacterium]|jgi:PhnB protein|nr:MAG: extradiol dioxygenase [Bacteroidota bacterium]
MKVSYKPANYNSVSPYLIVKGAQKMGDFLKELFGATELRRYDRPDGTVIHMEMRIDDSVIMLADSNENYPPNKHLLHVYVPDVDATFEKALQLGCKEIQKPKEQEGDPDRRGMFEDFSGNTWAIGTQVRAE